MCVHVCVCVSEASALMQKCGECVCVYACVSEGVCVCVCVHVCVCISEASLSMQKHGQITEVWTRSKKNGKWEICGIEKEYVCVCVCVGVCVFI